MLVFNVKKIPKLSTSSTFFQILPALYSVVSRNSSFFNDLRHENTKFSPFLLLIVFGNLQRCHVERIFPSLSRSCVRHEFEGSLLPATARKQDFHLAFLLIFWNSKSKFLISSEAFILGDYIGPLKAVGREIFY